MFQLPTNNCFNQGVIDLNTRRQGQGRPLSRMALVGEGVATSERPKPRPLRRAIEVHDAGDSDAPLPAGVVITVEPDVYIPHRALGLRIEDEILITPRGAELLSGCVPRKPGGIERLVAGGR